MAQTGFANTGRANHPDDFQFLFRGNLPVAVLKSGQFGLSPGQREPGQQLANGGAPARATPGKPVWGPGLPFTSMGAQAWVSKNLFAPC